ncbi:hypothetical protein FDP41_007752 [Naegleria fowleri]|uniref:Uncharacterized protein n=1 Tax=Naegleria fowleri TaxID=5763 RepID=A0A6A5C3A2_NAEFO|nr:uncharacterized protein FDP41_007752 [Naegleria fowleri]KAF0983837.1 hypothetical protein FDP41_007752 [Naegleria fowleri]CAG4714665.1 unnamed protein product [Naegleria fowleri]
MSSFLVYEAPFHTPHPEQSRFGQQQDDHSSSQHIEKSLFLAGGISGCGNWHRDVIQNLFNKCEKLFQQQQPRQIKIYNPRRENFDVSDQSQSEIQIKWEHSYLHSVHAVSFWFCSETLCPITLYELGKISMMPHVKLFVGVHPQYQRKLDVEIQTHLVRPEVKIVYSIEDLCDQIFDLYLSQ